MSDATESPIFLIADFAKAIGATPIKTLWQHRVDEHWTIALNGTNEEQEFIALGSEVKTKLKPFHALVEFNGWPAGIFHPYGGEFAAGELANQETFAAALKAASEKGPRA